MNEFDAIVIGSGPGGYVAAIRLGQLGLKALCIEEESFGGVCLNWGCIPSKALIHASHLFQEVKHGEKLGLRTKGVEVDFAETQKWKDGIVKSMTSNVQSLIKGNGGGVPLYGKAKLTARDTVEVTDKQGAKTSYRAKKGIIIATGASVFVPPSIKADGKNIVTAKEAVSFQSVPKHLLVLGGGIIGMELGMMYAGLGAKVTIVEKMARVLAAVDADLVRVVEKKAASLGMELLTQTEVTECKATGSGVEVKLSREGKTSSLSVDRVLVSVGFRPRSGGIGLESVGVKLDDRGHVVTDIMCRTNVPGIYAIGDVSGGPYLAHKASREAEIAAEVIAGHRSAKDWKAMPSAVFTNPEISVAGMMEADAKEKGIPVVVGKFPLLASGRALALAAPEGFVKIIRHAETEQVLGIAAVGAGASEWMAEGTLAIEMCATARDVALTIHSHPTMTEAVMEAFKHSLKEAVHILNR